MPGFGRYYTRARFTVLGLEKLRVHTHHRAVCATGAHGHTVPRETAGSDLWSFYTCRCEWRMAQYPDRRDKTKIREWVTVELLPEPGLLFGDTLSRHFGEVRVLRVSSLTPVPAICLDAI